MYSGWAHTRPSTALDQLWPKVFEFTLAGFNSSSSGCTPVPSMAALQRTWFTTVTFAVACCV